MKLENIPVIQELADRREQMKFVIAKFAAANRDMGPKINMILDEHVATKGTERKHVEHTKLALHHGGPFVGDGDLFGLNETARTRIRLIVLAELNARYDAITAELEAYGVEL